MTAVARLKITFGNAKLKGIYHFSLPSGWSCPGAENCRTFADRETGKITDEQVEVDGVEVRCYSAMDEARHPSVRKIRWHNFNLLKQCKSLKDFVDLISASVAHEIPSVGGFLRGQVGGEYFSYIYLKAWLAVAALYPKVTFYSYTKSIHLLARYLNEENELPPNFAFTCSKGGKFDKLIPETKIKTATILFSKDEANALGLEVDHTDGLAISSSKSFALLLHGCQKKGSKAAEALKGLKQQGFKGYNASRNVGLK